MKIGQKVSFNWLGKDMEGIIIDEYKAEDRKQFLVQVDGKTKYPQYKDDLKKVR